MSVDPSPDWLRLGLEVFGGAIGAAVTCVTIAWRLREWLSGKFGMVFERIDENRKKADDRHEENLRRFERLRVALAELGWRSGRQE